MEDKILFPDNAVIYAWEFEFRRKPFWRRLFSRKKYEWHLKSEYAQANGERLVAPGIMHFEEGGYSHTVHVYKGGNTVIYKMREE